ncbi:hypothetical protein HII36_54205 [Nonomuraea sp. NN258]|uniref:hypothetical protein n=1 Tax=Nonomuraea antri TaxID=2730852 RepID=UPI001569CB1A|nr:hypothetical protein [Nonomuraea antri]NRQ40707.1 hypothetical protein [Nonomuraea antri]
MLHVAAAIEAISLVVLLANLLTVHLEEVSGVVGPLHGLSYLTVIGAASMSASVSGAGVLPFVPGIGGLLVLRRLRSRPRRNEPAGT